jgi:hypothetical protein
MFTALPDKKIFFISSVSTTNYDDLRDFYGSFLISWWKVEWACGYGEERVWVIGRSGFGGRR